MQFLIFALGMILVGSTVACQYPPVKPTKVYEVTHVKPLPSPSPLSDEDNAFINDSSAY